MKTEIHWSDTINDNLSIVQNVLCLMDEAACHNEGDMVSDELIPILLDAEDRLQNVKQAADNLWEARRVRLLKEEASGQVEKESEEPDLSDVDFSCDPMEECEEKDRIHVVLDKKDVNNLRQIKNFFTGLEIDEIEQMMVNANCIHQTIIQQLAKQKEASKTDTAKTDSEASE